MIGLIRTDKHPFRVFFLYIYIMILTEPQNHIIQNIHLICKDYDLLCSYRLYHSNILEEGLDYIPIQYLTNNTFGFSIGLGV